jgi:hypothetical protein
MAIPLTTSDLLSAGAYEEQRPTIRRQIMAQKRARRVLIGTNCSIHVENRDIMRYQVLEMLRCENTWDDSDAVQEELDAYNSLVCQPGTLSVTVMFEYPTEEERQEKLPQLVNIDRHVWFQVEDDAPILGQFDVGQIDPEKISSVQFVKFPISESRQRRISREGVVLRFLIDHPYYNAQAVLGEASRQAIATDLSA